MATILLAKVVRSNGNNTMCRGTHIGAMEAAILTKVVKSNVGNTICRGRHEGGME